MVFVIGAILFFGIRSIVLPRTFGQYGHYRGAALGEIAARPIAYAGHAACLDCHEDVGDIKAKGKHAGVNCEACHGPLAGHAADPSAVKPQRLDTTVLCARCHEANAAKPRRFPQVSSKEHSGGAACTECHQPHSPGCREGTK